MEAARDQSRNNGLSQSLITITGCLQIVAMVPAVPALVSMFLRRDLKVLSPVAAPA